MKSAYLQNLDDAFLKSPESFGKKYEAKLEDFKILRLVGTGTFGKVFLVEQKHTKKQYAMKCIRKNFVLETDTLENLKIERDILLTIRHPFIVSMDYAI